MLKISLLDAVIIIGFLVSVILVGSAAARRSSKSASDFFLSGRSMPWWLLGVSMVACTFSCDTPNLVTDIVRTQGVAGTWAWWRFADGHVDGLRTPSCGGVQRSTSISAL